MSTQLRAFKPVAATQNTAVGATASTVSLNYTAGTVSIRLCNIGTQTVFVSFDGTTATLTTSVPIPAGQTEVFTLPTGTLSISVIAGATGSILYTTVGEGL
jgi:hypothetical protein